MGKNFQKIIILFKDHWLMIIIAMILCFLLTSCSPIKARTTKSNYEYEKIVKHKDGTIHKQTVKHTYYDTLIKPEKK